MKRICEFCGKEYDWKEGQPNWTKDGVGNGKGTVKSEKFCCYKCGLKNRQNKYKKACLEIYGVENPFQNEKIKNKIKEVFILNFGVDNPAKSKQIQTKIKQTCMKKYNGVAPACSLKVRQKSKQTKIKKYGNKNYNNREKYKQTQKERYGDENYNNREKTAQTNMKKYGVINTFQSEEKKQKTRQTILKKYNVEHISQSKQIKEKIHNKMPQILQKIYNTKKKNHTFNTSKPEKEMGVLLLEKFPDVKSQYKSQVYPFVCDFYIPSLDLYIELQGFWVHGKEPYNENNSEHTKIVTEWEKKSRNNSQYKRAIETWTIRDPMKRQTAKDNNLNWIEFFTMDQFMEWYNKQ